MKGQTITWLEPVSQDDGLSFMFKDATSGKTTYGAGRFLDTGLPKSGEIELDFNKAYNPPCAFTAYATCPLPPKQNVLTAAIEAGEKKYGKHGSWYWRHDRRAVRNCCVRRVLEFTVRSVETGAETAQLGRTPA